jgi:hypothetical protein
MIKTRVRDAAPRERPAWPPDVEFPDADAVPARRDRMLTWIALGAGVLAAAWVAAAVWRTMRRDDEGVHEFDEGRAAAGAAA